jgi:hypothetical protein
VFHVFELLVRPSDTSRRKTNARWTLQTHGTIEEIVDLLEADQRSDS